MLGTDLFQAYEQNMPVQAMNPIADKHDFVEQNHVTHQPTMDTEPSVQHPPTQIQSRDNYFSSADNSLQDQLQQLQMQLNNQKKIQKQDNILDRFVSKKKDVLKLVLMSMTILLAFSMHYIIIDLIKNCSLANEMSSNKEFFVKLAYPLSVLMVIWTIKVVNNK